MLLLAGIVAAQEQSFVVRVTPGTYVLSVAEDGKATLSPVSVLTPDGGAVTPRPKPSPVETVKEVSRKEYGAIGTVGDDHREPLAKKFRAFAFGIRKGLIPIEAVAIAEAAMVKDEVGTADASKFTDWQNAYRKAINAMRPVTAEDLATQYEHVADGLANLAGFNLAALLQILQFLFELFDKLGIGIGS